MQLDLSNDGRMPTGLLLLEDQIPYVLGTRPRFVVDRMGPKWKRSVGYQVRSDVRGSSTVGPMKVRLSDPFGLVELDRTFQTTSTLVVTPRVVPLPAVPLSGVWTGSGDNRPRAFASGSAEDVTVREYRRGDDLRRVHWRSSAHAGELMVRREEQPWQSRATLFVDNRQVRAPRHRRRVVVGARGLGRGLGGRAPGPARASASGWSPPVGEEQGGTWHEHGAATAETAPLLESLAVLDRHRPPAASTRGGCRGRPLRAADRGPRRPRRPRPSRAHPDAALTPPARWRSCSTYPPGTARLQRPSRRRPLERHRVARGATAGARSRPGRRTRCPRSGRSSGTAGRTTTGRPRPRARHRRPTPLTGTAS